MRTTSGGAVSRLVLFFFTSFVLIASITPALAKGKGEAAPDCQLKMLDDSAATSIAKLRGKVLYVDFWASWCATCHLSFPFMNNMDKELKGKGLQVLAVNLDEKLDDAQRFLTKNPTRFGIAVKTDPSCAKQFGVEGMPTSYIIDRDGKIQHVHQGFRASDAAELRGVIGKILGGGN